VLVKFFFELRAAGIPVTLTELLMLLEGLQARVAWLSAQQFYHFARLALIKDERYYDRFDRVFAEHFQGAEQLFSALAAQLPSDWLRAMSEGLLSEEEKRQVAASGGWEQLLETLRQRLAEQHERHEGGSKWIGTAGTSPYGHGGYNPEGVRMGGPGRERRAVRVWEQREFRNFDDTVELGTRNLKLALRKLRRFAREGAADQLDLERTINATARNAGLLDLKLMPERHNALKVLLFLDVGGSMEEHVRLCEQLFSAARSEFKHLEYFYFHNCPYQSLWKDNRRRDSERIDTQLVLRTYGPDFRAIFVGDAAMSPYEITHTGASIEQWNDEAGALWLQRLNRAFPHLVWLNPEPGERWQHTASIRMVRDLVGGRMFALTLAGLEQAIAALKRRNMPSPAIGELRQEA
jgi:uncharacterized protein with von Willebrand factor type A (vWA) domain